VFAPLAMFVFNVLQMLALKLIGINGMKIFTKNIINKEREASDVDRERVGWKEVNN
jgi:hypothetical protein